jgi:hypothetical protein
MGKLSNMLHGHKLDCIPILGIIGRWPGHQSINKELYICKDSHCGSMTVNHIPSFDHGPYGGVPLTCLITRWYAFSEN